MRIITTLMPLLSMLIVSFFFFTFLTIHNDLKQISKEINTVSNVIIEQNEFFKSNEIK